MDNQYKAIAGKNIVLGLRPEHILVDEVLDSTSLQATISHIENTGSDMLVYFELNGIKMRSAFKEQKSLVAGQRISIQIENGKELLFDAKTEQRIYPTRK